MILFASWLASGRGSFAKAYTIHSSFRELIPLYDAFILDQFGVMHDGTKALDGAVELVDHLHRAGKKLIILSNTSAPSGAALKKLPKFGFDNPSYFVGAVTSGEEASKYIAKTYGDDPASKALFITWDASDANNPRLTAYPEQFISQCGNVGLAESTDDADFLLLHGSEGWLKGNGDFQAMDFIESGSTGCLDNILKDCLSRNLEAVCANPDFIVRKPDGGSAYMPGKIAKRYEEMGGSVVWFGKPDSRHFEACIHKLGMVDRRRVAHVGDSLHHDIAGANSCGISNVFITGGIHAEELEVAFGETPSRPKLDEVLAKSGTLPTHVLSAFRL